jgi:hypothetical protein
VLLQVPYVERYGFGFSAHAHIAAANYGRSAFIMIAGSPVILVSICGN